MIESAIALPLIIGLPFVAGTTLAAVAGRHSARAAAWVLAAVTAAALGLLLAEAPAVFAGQSVTAGWPWMPRLGLRVGLRLDGLALLFALLILGIGPLVIVYARYYLGPADPPGKFYARLASFMGAMLGVVLADNLLLLAVFWELTSLTSFLLIGYWQHREDARQGARMALAVTGGGGLAMLAGFLLIGQAAGSYEISEIVGVADRVRSDPRYPVALILILLGAFTKSAQAPFHFWLPAAMAAPTPVSAYLHSATMVKAGVFLLARLYPILGGTSLFMYVVATTGLVTFVVGAYVAVFKHDLKGLLAYSTISHLGLITFLIGLDSPLSNVAAMFHVGNHATFKASLFMAAGIIEHETGTRDMRRLSGLWTHMPHTATLAIVAASAMAGVPLLNGFLSKEMFFAEALELRHLGSLGVVASVAVTLGAVFSVAYATRFIHDVFFHGEPQDLPRTPHEAPRFMKVPVEVLVAACIVVGLLPARTVGPLVDAAARAVFGTGLPAYSVALWHGFTAPLLVSAVAFAGGGAVYWALQRRYNLHLHVPVRWTARRLSSGLMAGLTRLAERVAAGHDTGSLQRSLAVLFVAVLALGGAPLVGEGVALGDRALGPVTPLGAMAGLVLAAAALGCTVWHHQRLVAVILTSVVGLVVSLALLALSAPDLALTQLAVEVVSTVLMLLALARLPQARPREASPPRRTRDATLAGLVGVGVAGVALAVMTRRLETISWYFVEHSVSRGGGANVVNVILVDFRGFDTFGEVTVLTIAALGVAAVLDGMRLAPPRANGRRRPARSPLLLVVAARWLLPLALVVSVYILFRGHNAPGGGFVAGLITAVALVLQQMAHGLAWATSRLPLDYARLAAAGLLVAGATGVGAWLFDRPFLTNAHAEPVVWVIGALPLASAALFDLGVYLTVVGTAMLALASLASASRHAGES
jgi:multicomponent K+:H+ antiporter subunit A